MSSTMGHELFVTITFEVAGVALFAIIADSNKTIGRFLVILMLSFAFIWLITTGSGTLKTILNHIPKNTPFSPGGATNPLGKGLL